MTHRLDDKVKRRAASMGTKPSNDKKQERPETTETETEPPQTIHIHYFPDAIVIVKEEEQAAQIVDSIPVVSRKISLFPAYVACCFYVFLLVSALAFQFFCLFNPPQAIVTIIPKSQTVTMTGSLQFGRVLPPLTISQSQIVPTTGIGHQDASRATGYITFYNGEFQSVNIAKGTILTGTSGSQVVTDQEAIIPAGNPPSYGQITVLARAMSVGTRGNIPAYDINQACCAVSVLAKNLNPFHGGQDEKIFPTVTQNDIHSISTGLKTSLIVSMQAALQSQLQAGEQIYPFSCIQTVTSNYSVGQEASTVNVTVSQTCSGVAYNRQELVTKVTALLAKKALPKTEEGYSLFGKAQMSVTTATIANTTPPTVFLSFQAQGTWVFALISNIKQQIKSLIAGKNTQHGVQILLSLPGVESVYIRFAGLIDTAKIPKNSANIRLVILAP